MTTPVTNQSDAISFDLNAIDKQFIYDPYPTLENLRQHDPVHFNPDGSLYLTRYEDVRAVYQDKTMVSDKTIAFKDKFGEGPLYEHHTTSLILMILPITLPYASFWRGRLPHVNLQKCRCS